MQDDLFNEQSLPDEYKTIPDHVMRTLRKLFPQARCELLAAPLPHQPGDILIEVDTLSSIWTHLLEEELDVDDFEHITKYCAACGSGNIRVDITAVDKVDFNLKRDILKGVHKTGLKFATPVGARRELEDVPYDLQIKEDIVNLLNPGQMVSYFLLASYAYYLCNVSPLTDTAYDRLCKRLLPLFGKLEHPHAYLIEETMLISGSGYDIREADYPMMVRVGVSSFIENIRSGQLVKNVLRF